ncbi:MAG TPA: DedA family protein [Bdellovibrionales bacterium]|jgi:membrane protein DedA with SNARE-associated domain|nr:DedA family protein [Bdellovibrionales bacterium]
MEHLISDLFSHYAYSPWLVYGGIVLFMMMSAFGLPIPEEVVLISAGFIGHMSLHPEDFPPPYPGAPSVNVYVLAVVAFAAVMWSDYLIYFLGKFFGPKLFKMRWFARLVSEPALERIQRWTRKYGLWAVFIFRFTPGVRFPGHLMCGAMGLNRWKFLAVDSVAAGISVPTQILLVSFYGEVILSYLGKFKLYFFGAMGIALLVFLIVKIYQKRTVKTFGVK